MKKILITLLLFVTFTVVYGQNKYQERQNNHYVEAAAKEFNLDKKQQVELSEIRMEMVSAYISSNKSFKAGDITQDEKKGITKEASKVFHNKLSEITGKTYAEMKDWLVEMRKELKTVK